MKLRDFRKHLEQQLANARVTVDAKALAVRRAQLELAVARADVDAKLDLLGMVKKPPRAPRPKKSDA